MLSSLSLSKKDNIYLSISFFSFFSICFDTCLLFDINSNNLQRAISTTIAIMNAYKLSIFKYLSHKNINANIKINLIILLIISEVFELFIHNLLTIYYY